MITIRCSTLYDITETHVKIRRSNQDAAQLRLAQQQSNLDTVLQVISIRSQPELLGSVKQQELVLSDCDFGFAYLTEPEQQTVKVWSFLFSVQHNSVFSDADHKLGALETDCENVPMITKLTESLVLPAFLTTEPDLRNIYFEIIDET